MKSQKTLALASFLALSCASAGAFAQLMPPAPTTTTTTTAPAPAPCMPLPAGTTTPPQGVMLPAGVTWCAPTAPVATPFSASQGEGYAHANAKGKQEIEEHFAMTGTIDKTNNILDVTAISSGHIRVGTRLTGMGLPGNGIEIIEMLTGKGGVGTYKFKPL